MEIKKLTIDYAEQIYSISKEQFKEESWSLEQIISSLKTQTTVCVGVVAEDKLVCYAIAQNSLDDINLLLIATLESQKQKGYAKQLLGYLENMAKTESKTFSLEVKNTNTAAISLYQKFGFKTLHTRKKYYKDGADALIMFQQKN